MSAGWTITEAATHLDPPFSREEVRAMVLLFAIPSLGLRRGGGVGRPAEEYDQPAILRAHAAVIAVRRGLLHALLTPRSASST